MNEINNTNTGIDTRNGTKAVNRNTVVLRAPGSPGAKKDGKNQLKNMGVGFVDSVRMEGDDGAIGQRSVIHLLPSEPLIKGKTLFIFAARGRELPDSIVAHATVGDRQPSHVLYHNDIPVGSSWVHQNKRGKFLVVKINKDVDDQTGINKRLTLFPKFASEKTSA